jgi:hypothetical protein
MLKTKASYDYEIADHRLMECAASAFMGHHEDEARKSPRRTYLHKYLVQILEHPHL